MKRIAMVGLLVGSLSMVDAADLFVGGLVGYENADAEVKVHNNLNGAEAIETSDQDNAIFGIKAGYIFNQNHRADVTIEKTNHGSGLVMVPLSLNYTYMSNWNLFNTTPFVGAGVGLIQWSETIECAPESKDVDFNGRMWQVRVGTAYQATPKVELQVFYRYRKAYFNSKSFQSGENDMKAEVNDVHTNGIFFGLNYMF